MFTYHEKLIPQSKYSIKCPYEMTAEFIVVHNTANDASAENEATYMTNNDSNKSFHYVIDDKVVIKLIPEWRNAFHAGDGSTGKGNRKGLSIEICYSKSGGEKFSKAEENAAIFISDLLKQFGWDISRVKKHQDFSNKYCPHRTLDLGWDRFLNMIKSHLDITQEVKSEDGDSKVNNGVYRIRKEWNEGKWSDEQIGAYKTYESALENYKNEYLNQGYKIFSPNGEILYPSSTIHPLANIMEQDGVTSDKEYWSKVFLSQREPSLEYVMTIIERYSDLLKKNRDNTQNVNNEPNSEYFLHNNVYIFPINIDKFKIKYFDKPKRNSDLKNYFNLGYFGNYVEGKTKFTLPSANLVADIDEKDVSQEALTYLKQRRIANGKIYFSANQNSTLQFKHKKVSTLIIEGGEPRVEKINQVRDTFDYAVSGVPVIIAGQPVEDYKCEGWSGGENRATYHSFLGIKGGKLFYFPMHTTTENCIDSKEVYNKIKDFGFSDVIKLDGGGSAYFIRNGEVQVNTSENRQINNIGIFD